MGRVRRDGYNFDTSSRPGTGTSNNHVVPAGPPAAQGHSTAPAQGRWARQPSRSHHRVPRNRRPKNTGCRNPQVRKGVASVVFMLGIPCLIAGVILTIVSSTDGGDEGNKYPASFSVAGPLLVAFSIISFVVGVLLYNIRILTRLRDCFDLSDKDSFFRRHFPRLSAWLKPDTIAALNQAAINNLQTAPARSAMRKMPNPDLVALETKPQDQGEGHHPHQGHHDGHHNNLSNDHHHHHSSSRHQSKCTPPPRRKRAVTFSQGDSDLDAQFTRLSASSEPDRVSLHSENGGGGGNGSLNGHSPSTSLLSLRHCKIHPKDDVFWTDVSGVGGGGVGGDGGRMNNSGGGEGGVVVGTSDGGGHPAASEDSIVSRVQDSDCGGGGGGRRCENGDIGGGGGDEGRAVKFSSADTDEERA